MELLSDYDCTIKYHPGKANKKADALSRKNQGYTLKATSDGYVASVWVRPVLAQRIRAAQNSDPEVQQIRAKLADYQQQGYTDQDGELRRSGRIYVPDSDGLRREILEEAHHSVVGARTVPGMILKMGREVRGTYDGC